MEKNVCVREEEVLLVNGTPITLEGEEGRAIKVRGGAFSQWDPHHPGGGGGQGDQGKRRCF